MTSVIPGTVIALRSNKYNRFVCMTDERHEMGGIEMSPSMREGVDLQLPLGNSVEGFHVIDGGDGSIGLWNAVHKRCMRMNDQCNVDVGECRSLDELSPSRLGPWERFHVVDAGNGSIALWSQAHTRFVRMNGDLQRRGGVDASEHKEKNELPPANKWTAAHFAHFTVVVEPAHLHSAALKEISLSGFMNGIVCILGAGCCEVNGLYRYAGKYGSYDTWDQMADSQFQLWRNSSQGRGWEWRIGFKNDYYYVNASESVFENTWTCATGVEPPPCVKELKEIEDARQKELAELRMRLSLAMQETVRLKSELETEFPHTTYCKDGVRVVKIQCPGVSKWEIQTTMNGAIVTLHRKEALGVKETTKQLTFEYASRDGHFVVHEKRTRLENGFLFVHFEPIPFKSRIISSDEYVEDMEHSDGEHSDGSWVEVHDFACNQAQGA